MDQNTEVKGGTVNVRWKKGSCPANVALYVYYREVLPGNNASKWEKVNVPQAANNYVLELKCFKQYEIVVTGWKATEKLRPWKVNTGKGEKRGFKKRNSLRKQDREKKTTHTNS